MSTVLPSPEVQATGCEALLRQLCDDYYQGYKAYVLAAQVNDPARVFHRARLDALADFGDRLAAALGWAEPEWEAMRHLAEPEEQR